MDYFKPNDELEKRVVKVFLPILNLASSNKTDFYNDAFICFLLGDVLFNLKRDPLAGVVTRGIFRSSFPEIHNLFTRPGTFEFYMDVFRAVWGNDVDVEFEIPSPGVLLINIKAVSVGTELFMARRIENGLYVYDEVIDHEGDNIVFQGTFGIKSQRETDALIHELHPAGVYVKATLEIE